MDELRAARIRETAASGPDGAPGSESQECAGIMNSSPLTADVKGARGLARESAGTGHPCHLRQCCLPGPVRERGRGGGRAATTRGGRSLVAGGRQMAGDLRVDAYVIERARHNGGDNVARVGTALRGRAVVTTLTSGYCTDDQPDHHDKTSNTHVHLRKTGRCGHREVLRPGAIISSTPAAADTRAEGIVYAVCGTPGDFGTFPATISERRCIVAADGLGCKDRITPSSGQRGRASCRRFAA